MSRSIAIEYSEIQEQVFFNWPEGIKYKTWRKGRRAGATKGAAHAFIELMLFNDVTLLWGDTINSNISRYFERYFEPVLKSNNIEYYWSDRDKQLIMGKSICDFRSCDNPETWEGFGYHTIFLNEAGIILKNQDLYLKSVLPMLMDFPDTQLIAAGVPKGKKTKDGKEHIFYTLHKRAKEQPEKYMDYVSTAYDNPWIKNKDVDELKSEMFAMGGQSLVAQEIYGEFVDKAATNPFIIHFDRAKHIKPVRLDLNKQLFISLDFNLIPFGCIASHIWEDQTGHHYHVVDCFKIMNGSIPAMVDELKMRYLPWLPTLTMTGDHMGNRGEISQRDNASNYTQIMRALNLRESQKKTPANPTHDNSKNDCNYVFYTHPDIAISEQCEDLIFDFENVEIDNTGQIIKLNRKIASQQADLLDCFRNQVNTHLKKWINIHQKSNK